MQIHELTKRRPAQVDEGWQDSYDAAKGAVSGAIQTAKTAIANPIRSMTAPKGSASLASRVQASKSASSSKLLSKKFIDAWHLYAMQMEKGITDPRKKQAFDARTDGTYEKALTAWVQKNLLSGMYLPNLTNKDEILDLVSQLSIPRDKPLVAEGRRGSKGSAKRAVQRAVPNPSGMSVGGNALDPANPADAKIIAAINKQQSTNPATAPITNFGKGVNMPVNPITVPGAGTSANPAPASPSAPTPPLSAPATTTTPSTAIAPVGAPTPPGSPSTGAGPAPVTPAGPKLTAQKEQELFTQLVQQAGLSQNTASTGTASGGRTQAGAGSTSSTGATSQSIAPAVQQAVAKHVNPQTLKAIGQALSSFTQNNMNIHSTGQPSVDALLTFMGFTVQ